MTLGENIRKYRKANGLTQENLAELLNVSTQTISYWECNVNMPSTDKLGSIAKHLHITAGQLIDTDDFTMQWELRDQMFATENMYEHVRSEIINYKLTIAKQALPLMMQLHKDQTRSGSGHVAYASHPLMMAWQALALGIMEDDVITTILLHGVWRNCGITPEELDISLNSKITHALKLLYYEIKPGETEAAAKKRYYAEIAGDSLAAIVRVIDQCNKISTIAIGFPKEKLSGYIQDTEFYVLPLLETVQQNYLDYYNVAFLLKYQILSVIEGLKRTLHS